jgi:hypothetical protein
MKTPILFFVLLTFISTSKVETNIVEKVYCLLTNEEIKLYVVDLIETIKTKDVPKILNALLEGYNVLKNEIEKCWNNEPLLLSPAKKKKTPTLPEKRKPTECESNCYGSCMHIKKHFEYAKCADDCIKEKCKQ